MHRTLGFSEFPGNPVAYPETLLGQAVCGMSKPASAHEYELVAAKLDTDIDPLGSDGDSHWDFDTRLDVVTDGSDSEAETKALRRRDSDSAALTHHSSKIGSASAPESSRVQVCAVGCARGPRCRACTCGGVAVVICASPALGPACLQRLSTTSDGQSSMYDYFDQPTRLVRLKSNEIISTSTVSLGDADAAPSPPSGRKLQPWQMITLSMFWMGFALWTYMFIVLMLPAQVRLPSLPLTSPSVYHAVLV